MEDLEERLIEALERNNIRYRRSGHNIYACCPAHDDRDPSLSISITEDKILLRCHSGCEFATVRDALGLTNDDLREGPGTAPVGEFVTEYVYTDADAVVLGIVQRYVDPETGKKTFRQQSWVDGAWEWHGKGLHGALYREPEMQAARAAGKPIYLPAGEKDVDTAYELGLAATTHPGGEGKGKFSDVHASRFGEGDDLVIIQDNDDTGRTHASEKAARLRAVGATVTIMQAASGCKDLTEHVEAGFGVVDLVAVAETPDELALRLLRGGAFIHDAPQQVPAVWGLDDEVLWARDEPLMITGPTGVGKTTLGGQVVAGLLGLLPEVLGYPVVTAKCVLYLAMDRPAQIRRALARLLRDHDRDVLDERLIIWPGPPPADLAKHPDMLLRLARTAKADVVVLDSLKDAAIKLTDDEVGQGINRAMQHCVTEGVQVLAYHHQKKSASSGVGGKPNTLADVYGSTWITAGCGSVVLLWGSAGDPIVELEHRKQPAAEVGPFKILHDHVTGTSAVWQGVDALTLLRTRPYSASEVAKELFGSAIPSDAEVAKARRKLDKLVASGQASKTGGTTRGGAKGGPKGGSDGVRYVASSTPTDAPTPTDEATDAPSSGSDDRRADKRPTADDVSPGHPNDAPTDATDTATDRRANPSFKEGARRRPTSLTCGCGTTQEGTTKTRDHGRLCPDHLDVYLDTGMNPHEKETAS